MVTSTLQQENPPLSTSHLQRLKPPLDRLTHYGSPRLSLGPASAHPELQAGSSFRTKAQ